MIYVGLMGLGIAFPLVVLSLGLLFKEMGKKEAKEIANREQGDYDLNENEAPEDMITFRGSTAATRGCCKMLFDTFYYFPV